MNAPSISINVLAALVLSLTCAACGRAAVTPQMRQGAELRTIIVDETPRTWQHDANASTFEDPSSARAQRLLTDDSGLQDARAARSGWAASDAR